MNALVTVAADTSYTTCQALTRAYDARDAAIARAQELAAAVNAKRDELDALVAEAHAAAAAVHETTRAWSSAMHAHAAAVEIASDCVDFCLGDEMDGGAVEALLAFDPNAV
jgi:ABC-type transporter Mla subunit MlaD